MSKQQKWRAKTREELIIEVWESLDCDSVGAAELENIQRIVEERFGRGAVESPAAIARTVADEGAMLRHPEVLEYDSTWRANRFSEDLDFSTLESAALSLKRLDDLRAEIDRRNDRLDMKMLLDAVKEYKGDLLLVSRSKVPNQAIRAQAQEIALWLDVWLQQPELFADWLSLRTSTQEFVQKFGDRSNPQP
jgi:hypothetical protein